MAKWGFWDWVSYCCLGIAAVGLAVGTVLKSEPVMFSKLHPFFTNSAWNYAPAILFALGTIILAVRYAVPLITGQAISPASTGRVFVESTPAQLSDLIKDHTSVQAKKLSEIYIGKWMKVSGTVRNVHSYPKFASVVMLKSDGQDGRDIELWFAPRWDDRIRPLSKDQKITAVGQISEIRYSDILLKESELVDSLSPTIPKVLP